VAKDQNPEATRKLLLESAFTEFYHNGFQGTGLQTILEKAGVSKGALFHHFKSKLELGYAVAEEMIGPMLLEGWMSRHADGTNPVDVTQEFFRRLGESPSKSLCENGCPLYNLILEMSPVDETFRVKLQGILERWIVGFADALASGQTRGQVRTDVEPRAVAAFVIATFEGAVGMTKNTRRPDYLRMTAHQMEQYLETLRPEATAKDDSDH